MNRKRKPDEEERKRKPMAKCKFCGKPVKSAPVFHAKCMKAKMMEAAQQMCDEYCRFARELDADELVEQCLICPMVEVVEMGGGIV